MQRIYLSVLGTTDYLSCIYFQRMPERAFANIRFVQEATVRMICKDWTEKDRVVIFTTQKAYRANWLNDGHVDRKSGVQKQCSGLKQCLGALDLRCKVDNISIPDGRSEEEIWELFRIIEKQISFESEIFVDITHSLRSLPMLAMVALNYAKTTKKINIGGIYYGALEAIGDIQTVQRMTPEERRVPIFDLTAFDQLLDWALGVDRFVASGDARYVAKLAQRSVKPVLAMTQGKDTAASSVRRLAGHLSDFTEVLSTCRGVEIKEIGRFLKQALSEYRPSRHATALEPLIERIRDGMNQFEGEHISDGLQAVRWCQRHNLIQQGFTILLETIVTAVLLSIDADIMDLNARKAVTGAASLLQSGKPDNEKDLEDRFYLQCKTYLEEHKELVAPITRLINFRNDLNHAGWKNDAIKPKRFRAELEKLIDTIEPILT